jgi:hypothetical protein
MRRIFEHMLDLNRTKATAARPTSAGPFGQDDPLFIRGEV